ncbi:LTA synthase family protein [Vibrio marisflavi]|uniref:Phosphoglycerol transferase I n=1 Tax=Vibrio marisflavi CECT 7928 TaxID=634439 RepID=A0ABM9A870_9VIBR|nr:LTA synthase family protein [Vibrio marisflavi]CAH0541876.1 Phosphoglycerol transferase I [Vibrio marisflavi CECT 7928]
MNIFKKRLGVLYPIVISALVILALFGISRLVLSIWLYERLPSISDWLTVLGRGVRIDLASVSYLLILPALLATLLSFDNVVGKIWNWLLRVWITAGLWLVVYMEVATPPFILQYDLRPNRNFIEYLIYPKEVFSMLWTGYKLELFISTATTILTLYVGWRWTRSLVSNLHYQKWYWRPFLAILVVAIGVMGARSTLGHRPLNPALVAYSSDPMVNDLILNSSYSVIFAAKQMSSEKSAFDFYPNMPEKEVIEVVRDSMNVGQRKFESSEQPTLTYHQSPKESAPKNIVIVLMESQGARYVKSLGGIDTSPNLDRLMNEGWAFTNMYSTGTRSVRGIEAVITGFTPTPSRAVVKLGKSQTDFFTIADLLKSKGYVTQFVYGGESHFDNMKSFFLGNGFTDIKDLPTFNSPKFVGSWGASDEDLFDKADQEFTKLNKEGKPFFSLVFTSSNHTPYEYPEGTIKHYNSPNATLENAVKYADYAVGKFIDKARKSTYWDDTIFLVIADHDSRATGSLPVPVGHFHIPAIILGKSIPAHIDKRLVSQIDMSPTLLSLAGISGYTPMIGHDLTKKVPLNKQRALMQRDRNFGWLNAQNELVVIRPEKAPATYLYDPKSDSLEEKIVEPEVVRQAKAHALWGSLAYEKDYYKALEDYQNQH